MEEERDGFRLFLGLARRPLAHSPFTTTQAGESCKRIICELNCFNENPFGFFVGIRVSLHKLEVCLWGCGVNEVSKNSEL